MNSKCHAYVIVRLVTSSGYYFHWKLWRLYNRREIYVAIVKIYATLVEHMLHMWKEKLFFCGENSVTNVESKHLCCYEYILLMRKTYGQYTLQMWKKCVLAVKGSVKIYYTNIKMYMLRTWDKTVLIICYCRGIRFPIYYCMRLTKQHITGNKQLSEHLAKYWTR